MDSSNVSKLNMIQESSDAATKDLAGPCTQDPRLGTREDRDPRLGARDPRLGTQESRDPRLGAPRGSRPENGPEHGM